MHIKLSVGQGRGKWTTCGAIQSEKERFMVSDTCWLAFDLGTCCYTITNLFVWLGLEAFGVSIGIGRSMNALRMMANDHHFAGKALTAKNLLILLMMYPSHVGRICEVCELMLLCFICVHKVKGGDYYMIRSAALKLRKKEEKESKQFT